METFKIIDADGDGLLTKQELEEALKNNNHFLNKNDIDEIFKRLDDNDSGAIDYTEFVTASLNRRDILNDEKITACFNLFDRDKSGSISIHEFQKKFQKAGGVDNNMWKEMINEADKNGDGVIDFQEFKELLKKLI